MVQIGELWLLQSYILPAERFLLAFLFEQTVNNLICGTNAAMYLTAKANNDKY